jgi:TonB-dependent SusC/RagA subfamily outer membrane receptor
MHMGAVTDDEALYMVDGVIWPDISILRPQDIKSINVVKDGATFGFRGANGVVLITTVDNHQKSERKDAGK